MRQKIAATALLASLMGCGGGSPSENCVPLSKSAVAAINDGAKGAARVTAGQAVKMPGEPELPMLTYVAAINVKDGADNEQAFVTLDDPKSPGGIFAADNVARLYLTWGGAAKKGSPVYEAAQAAWMSASADDARGCLKASLR